jgi:formylglycine-generating enzyme required for sulfatase activity
LPPDLKIKAWKKFSEAFSEDNLYSQEDDSMRQKAEERMTYWQEKQERIEQKKLEQKEAEQKKIAMGKRPEKEIKGKTYKDPITGMEFIFVKGGCYEMGDTFGDGYDNEKPVHEVCVDDFYIGKYEVTQAQWKAIMGNNPSYFKDCGDNCPVEQVSWNEIQEFINKLNQGAGTNKYRLPTEAEWEYAARSGGKKEKYAGTSNESELGEYAWYDKNSGSKTHPVGQKKPNGLGIYDMSGNVWEWVQDWYDENYYRSSPKDNPKGAYSGQYRVLRGGSWIFIPRLIRAAYRDWLGPTVRNSRGGFRVALPAH